MLRSLPLAAVTLLAAWATAQNPPTPFQLNVSHGGNSYLANFELHSARGPNFALRVQQSNGALATYPAGPVRTYIGTIAGHPGAMASALRRANGAIYYHVLFEDGFDFRPRRNVLDCGDMLLQRRNGLFSLLLHRLVIVQHVANLQQDFARHIVRGKLVEHHIGQPMLPGIATQFDLLDQPAGTKESITCTTPLSLLSDFRMLAPPSLLVRSSADWLPGTT
jgi:hypothetical protein